MSASVGADPEVKALWWPSVRQQAFLILVVRSRVYKLQPTFAYCTKLFIPVILYGFIPTWTVYSTSPLVSACDATFRLFIFFAMVALAFAFCPPGSAPSAYAVDGAHGAGVWGDSRGDCSVRSASVSS